MKSTKDERVTPKDKYPCLKVSATGRIVLFWARNYGTIVHVPSGLFDELGVYSERNEDEFTTYHGTVTLEN